MARPLDPKEIGLSDDSTVDNGARVGDHRVHQSLSHRARGPGQPPLGADDEVMDHGGTSLSVVRILAEAQQVST